jgi:subtilase family serine protease
VPGNTRVKGAVVLRSHDEGALTSFISAVTTPGSGLFHDYLRAGAFAGRFGPAPAVVDAVRSELAEAGSRITSVARDGLVVDFAGPARAAERAFGTGLDRYRLADGRTGQATTSAIRVPAAVAGEVMAVVGLDSLAYPRAWPVLRTRAPADRGRSAARAAKLAYPPGSPHACAAALTSTQYFGAGLTDSQVAHAYGAFGLYSAGDLGAGQHIAIFEVDPFLRSDIHTFDTCYFGAPAAAKMAGRLHVIPVLGGMPAGPGVGEAVADIETVSAMAPLADLDVYEAPLSFNGVLDEFSAIVNNDADQVVSVSYGLCEQAAQQAAPGLQQSENVLFQRAAAQGQSLVIAAGDTGSDSCNQGNSATPASGQNPLSVADPASQPYVISVGGTTMTDPSQPPAEQVWNDGSCCYAGAGGISNSWAMPAWQRSALVPGIVLPGSPDYRQASKVEREFGYLAGFCQPYLPGASPATPCRTLPDVSSDADPFTGISTYYQGIWALGGGTSVAAPTWAAMLALINASPACKSSAATATGVGFAEPLLYAVASDPAVYKASFNDITSGNNDIYGLDNGRVFPAIPGYDLASGLGSPELTGRAGTAGLAFYLCSYGARVNRPAVVKVSPAVLPTRGGTVTITGTGFTRDGTGGPAGSP